MAADQGHLIIWSSYICSGPIVVVHSVGFRFDIGSGYANFTANAGSTDETTRLSFSVL